MKSFNQEEDDSTCSSNSDTLSSNSLSIDFSPENNTETETVDLNLSPQESELRGTEEEAKEELCTQSLNKPESEYFAPPAEQPCCSTFTQGFFPFIPILIFMGNQGPSKNNDDSSESDSDDDEQDSKPRPKKRPGRKPSKLKPNLKKTMKKVVKKPQAAFRKAPDVPKPPPPVVENATRSSNRIRGVPPPDFFPGLRHSIPPEVCRLARSPGGHLANQRQQLSSEEPARIYPRHRAFLPDGKGDKNWAYLMQFVRENYVPLYPGEFSNSTARELESIVLRNGAGRAKKDPRSGNGSGDDSGFEGGGHQLNANNNEDGSNDGTRQRQAQTEINGQTSEIQMTPETNGDISADVAGDAGYNDASSSHVMADENNNYMTQELAQYYAVTSDGRFVQNAEYDAAPGPVPGLAPDGRYEQYEEPRSAWGEFNSIQTSSTYTMNGGIVNTVSPVVNGGAANGMMYPPSPPPPYYPYQNMQPGFNLQYQPPQPPQPWNHPSSFFPFNEPLPLRNYGQFGPGLGDFLGLPPPPPYPGHSTWPPQVIQNFYQQSNSIPSGVAAQSSSTVPCACVDCTRRSANVPMYEMDFEPYQPEPFLPELQQREPEESPLQPEEIPNLIQDSPRQPEEIPRQPEEIPRQPEEILRQPEEIPRQREESPRQREESPHQREESPRQPEQGRSQPKLPSEYFYAVPNSSSEDEFEAESDYEGPPSD